MKTKKPVVGEPLECVYCHSQNVAHGPGPALWYRNGNNEGVYQTSIFMFCNSCENTWYLKMITESEKTTIQITGPDFIDYKEYIASAEWRHKAEQAKIAAFNSCQLCDSRDRILHAHHKTYARLGFEDPSDITVLCSDCHAKFHSRGTQSE